MLENEIELVAGLHRRTGLDQPARGCVIRAAAFAVHSLPISRFPDAEHLYSATGLAPAMYESATLRNAAAGSLVRAWPSTVTR